MIEFYDWDDIRAELDDGDADSFDAERARTEALLDAFHLSEERQRLGLAQREDGHRRLGSGWSSVGFS